MNWLNLDLEYDKFGRALLDSGLTKERIEEWSKDPQIQVSESNTGSVFDTLEDMNVQDCVMKLIALNKFNLA
jgi:hypothetical protein